jgi:hypothetical protein
VHVLSDSQRYREYGNPVPSFDMLGSRKSPKGANLNSSPDPSEKSDEERKDGVHIYLKYGDIHS